METLAVIDAGTNTFHLLIARKEEDRAFSVVYRQREFVKLALGGLDFIDEAAFSRGLRALQEFREVIDSHESSRYRAVGTAALRMARNGGAFLEAARSHTGLEIQLIDGHEEARYIYQGIQLTLPESVDNCLILDIGGGSVECIHSRQGQQVWAESFIAGVSHLRKEFHQQEPIGEQGAEQCRQYLAEVFLPLAEYLRQNPISVLVGAAGAFDVLRAGFQESSIHPHLSRISMTGIRRFSHEMVHQTAAQRLFTPFLPAERSDMITVAMILVEYLMDLMGCQVVLASDYGMKEGILAEML